MTTTLPYLTRKISFLRFKISILIPSGFRSIRGLVFLLWGCLHHRMITFDKCWQSYIVFQFKEADRDFYFWRDSFICKTNVVASFSETTDSLFISLLLNSHVGANNYCCEKWVPYHRLSLLAGTLLSFKLCSRRELFLEAIYKVQKDALPWLVRCNCSR